MDIPIQTGWHRERFSSLMILNKSIIRDFLIIYKQLEYLFKIRNNLHRLKNKGEIGYGNKRVVNHS